MSAVIRQHNSSILKDRKTEGENFAGGKSCNCRVKDNCPLHGKFQVQSVVYKATVTTTNDEKDYTGLTAQTFKVARNEVENASFAQRSAHRDSRIWRPKLIEPAA